MSFYYVETISLISQWNKLRLRKIIHCSFHYQVTNDALLCGLHSTLAHELTGPSLSWSPLDIQGVAAVSSSMDEAPPVLLSRGTLQTSVSLNTARWGWKPGWCYRSSLSQVFARSKFPLNFLLAWPGRVYAPLPFGAPAIVTFLRAALLLPLALFW